MKLCLLWLNFNEESSPTSHLIKVELLVDFEQELPESVPMLQEQLEPVEFAAQAVAKPLCFAQQEQIPAQDEFPHQSQTILV